MLDKVEREKKTPRQTDKRWCADRIRANLISFYFSAIKNFIIKKCMPNEKRDRKGGGREGEKESE